MIIYLEVLIMMFGFMTKQQNNIYLQLKAIASHLVEITYISTVFDK